MVLTASFGSRLSLNVIYKMSFDSRIVPVLSPNTKIVPKYGVLSIYISNTKAINYDGAFDKSMFEINWTCNVTDLCVGANENYKKTGSFSLGYDEFLATGYPFMQNIEVKATLKSKFIFGDGKWTTS